MQSYEAVAWLRGELFPQVWRNLLEEGRQDEEHPGTLTDGTARIRETLSFLESLDSDVIDAGADRPIALELPDGRVFDTARITADLQLMR